jgi:hypothetical protein
VAFVDMANPFCTRLRARVSCTRPEVACQCESPGLFVHVRQCDMSSINLYIYRNTIYMSGAIVNS